MAEQINQHANQPKVDEGMEISPDGGLISQMAAPSHAPRIAPAQQQSQSMEKAPSVDEHGNEIKADATDNAQRTEKEPSQVEQVSQKTDETQEKLTDFTEFLKVKDTGEPTDEIQKQKVEDKVSEVKTKEKDKGQQAQAQQKPPIAVRKEQDLSSRDLTGLPDDLQPHFQKDMSRAAFDKIKPLILEHKTLKDENTAQKTELERLRKGAIPDSYYDNPAGFVLDPAYINAESTAVQAQQILNHWQNQYKAIRDGATEFKTLGYDQQGNLVITGREVADKDSEFKVMTIVNNAQQQYFKVAAKAEGLRENFQNRHQNAIGWLQQYEDRAFPVFKTEQGKQFQLQVESVLKEFPAELRSHPVARMLAKSLVTNIHLGTLLVQQSGKAGGQAQSQQQTTQTVNGKPATAQQQQQRAGPTVSDTGGDAAGKGGKESKEVTMDDFAKAKEESF